MEIHSSACILTKIPISSVVANKGNASLDRRQITGIGKCYHSLASAQRNHPVMLISVTK